VLAVGRSDARSSGVGSERTQRVLPSGYQDGVEGRIVLNSRVQGRWRHTSRRVFDTLAPKPQRSSER